MTSPPGASPFLSADGMWRWDGVRWVPVSTAPVPARPMRARWVALIVAGSIASLLLAGTGLAAVSSAYGDLGSRFAAGASSSCLPSDFPAYPGAAIVTSLKAFSVCTAAFTTRDPSADVIAYFQTQLDQYPWQVTGGSGDQGTVDFGRQDGAKGSGEVSVSQSTRATQIQIVYQS
jgi:hypothetical protein